MVQYLSKYYHQQSPCSAIFVCRVRILLSFSDIKSSIFLIFISRIFQIDLDLDYFPSLSYNQIILNQVTSIVSLISPMVQSFSQIISSCYCCLSPFWNLFLAHTPINQSTQLLSTLTLSFALFTICFLRLRRYCH